MVRPYAYDEITLVEGYPGGPEAAAAGILIPDDAHFLHAGRAEDWARFLLRPLARARWRDRVGACRIRRSLPDEGFSSFARNNVPLIRLLAPKLARAVGRFTSWLPPMERETLRSGNLQLTLARNEIGPAVQELLHYEHAGRSLRQPGLRTAPCSG